MKTLFIPIRAPLFRFILSFSLILFTSSLSYAQMGWRYENPITIHNTTSTTLTNYQVLVKFNTQLPISLGWMKNDGSDIRFASDCGSTVIPHWLERYINTDSTKLWVKVTSIPANDSVRIYLYYGNPASSNTSTITVFNGPNSSTDSVMMTSTNTVSNCQRGFRFTPNEQVLVTHFGKRTPNATQRYITLFDFTSQTIVAQLQVDAGSVGSYNYNQLTTPLWLNSGQQYVLELFNGSGDMYYYGTSSQIGQGLTYGDMKYCNSCTQNTFPTSTLTNYHYGQPDFLYWRKQTATSEPTYFVGLPADTNTPAIPTGLHAFQGNQQATIIWNRNTEFDMSYYNLYRNIVKNPNTSSLVAVIYVPDSMKVNTGLTNGVKYYFWLKAADRYCINRVSGFSQPDSVVPNPVGIVQNAEIPKVFKLYQNLPNPFNPTTTIKFDVPKKSLVTLVIYDAIGREVANLVNAPTNAGSYQITWYAGDFPSGVYFCKIKAGDYTDVKKMILVK
jgi:hypothetical protein